MTRNAMTIFTLDKRIVYICDNLAGYLPVSTAISAGLPV